MNRERTGSRYPAIVIRILLFSVNTPITVSARLDQQLAPPPAGWKELAAGSITENDDPIRIALVVFGHDAVSPMRSERNLVGGPIPTTPRSPN